MVSAELDPQGSMLTHVMTDGFNAFPREGGNPIAAKHAALIPAVAVAPGDMYGKGIDVFVESEMLASEAEIVKYRSALLAQSKIPGGVDLVGEMPIITVRRTSRFQSRAIAAADLESEAAVTEAALGTASQEFSNSHNERAR